MGDSVVPSPETLWSNLAKPDCRIPTIPTEAPWAILNPEHPHSLKSQLHSLLIELGSSYPDGIANLVDESAGPVYVDNRATIDNGSRIIGPCYIGPECVVRFGAFIRPFTWACRGSVIGHSTEVKHSLLLPGAKAPHFNYLGDSIIGSGVNLGAGTKLSNLRHDGKEISVHSSSGKTSTGLRKFGALLGDGCQLGCNSVTNPGTILGRNCMVDPCACVSGIHPDDCRFR